MKENAPLQLKLMDFIKNRLIRETQAQARFYQEIRGRIVYLHFLTLGKDLESVAHLGSLHLGV